jgi:hypothetical protein
VAILASTVAGARSQFRSYLTPLAYGGTPPGYSPAGLRGGYASFWPQALLPFFANAQGIVF